MGDLLEGLFDPVLEGFVEFLIGAPRSVTENGWTESDCRIQTLNAVWWNADVPRGTNVKAPSTLGFLLSVVLTLAGLK